MLEYLKQHADYLSLSTCMSAIAITISANSWPAPWNWTAHQDGRGHHRRGAFRSSRAAGGSISPGTNGTSGIARAATQERGRRILEEHYNLEDALVVATFLNSFVNHAHIVKIANMAQLVNVIAPIFTNEQGMFLQTIYYPLQLFANNAGEKRWSCSSMARHTRAGASTKCPIWTAPLATMTARWC